MPIATIIYPTRIITYYTFILTTKMPLISETQALILFVTILVVAAILAWWLGSYANYDKCSFHTFIAILAGFGIFVTFLFYYNLVLLQNQQQQLAVVQELARLNESVLNSVLDELKDASVLVPNFVLSVTPLTNVVCCDTGATGAIGTTCSIPVGTDPITPQTCTEKLVLSYRIFSLWQDVIVSNKFMKFNPIAYVSNFLQRANSSQLYVQWLANRINFNESTQVFGDLLFEYGLPITNQTPQEYEAVAERLITDPRYDAIF